MVLPCVNPGLITSYWGVSAQSLLRILPDSAEFLTCATSISSGIIQGQCSPTGGEGYVVGRDKRPPEGDLGAFWAGEPRQLAAPPPPGESSGSVEGRGRERRDTIHTAPSREDLRALICLNPACRPPSYGLRCRGRVTPFRCSFLWETDACWNAQSVVIIKAAPAVT